MHRANSPNNTTKTSTSQAADLLRRLTTICSIQSVNAIVTFWIAKGAGLALAEPFLQPCLDSLHAIQELWSGCGSDWNSYTEAVAALLRRSERPLVITLDTTLSEYLGQLCGPNARLETLGICLAALIRAINDTPIFPPLYVSDEKRYRLQRTATKLLDCVVEMCLSLDRLHDVQLVLQFEHFIVHSNVSGDQSLRTWRSLGDVIASAFALGYHEKIPPPPSSSSSSLPSSSLLPSFSSPPSGIPAFLLELRTTALARVYASDKSFAVFLGRPPRLSRRFAWIRVPSGVQPWHAITGENSCKTLQDIGWDPRVGMNFRTEARWSALCAGLKEEVLEVFLGGERLKMREQVAGEVIRRVDELWEALPAHFKLTQSLKSCDRSPFERDFLLGVRLNYLHVVFLVRLVSLQSLTRPSEEIVCVSQQILSLVVEGVLFRECLGNSGSGIVWKVAQFGLPAAGVILLSALHKRGSSTTSSLPYDRCWRDLSVLVAEIQLGSLVKPGEPNYVLLSTAARTMQAFLESPNDDKREQRHGISGNNHEVEATEELLGRFSPDPWNLEMGQFWQDLAEHPFLSNSSQLPEVEQDLS